MTNIAHGIEATPDSVDEITAMLYRGWDELFAMDRPEVEAFQLAAVRQRIEELKPGVAALAAQIDGSSTRSIAALEDVPPLLFNHVSYKSYPASLVEKGRFDLLTKWLSGLTSVDLSSVDTAHCEGIDDWLGELERQSPLMPLHTSGTSGKLSFFPRTVMECSLFFHAHLKKFTGFGDTQVLHSAMTDFASR